jgi:patatin-like phospholipase/acyl hydrolase
MNLKNYLNYFVQLYLSLSLSALFLVSCGADDETKKLESSTTPEAPKKPGEQAKEAAAPIRILSLDGGGIRGVIAARILAGFEKETGKKIHELFDIFAGTSTGGLLAIILNSPLNGKGPMSAQEAEQFYVANGKNIFKYNCSRYTKREICLLRGPLYNSSSIETMISSLYGNQLFSLALKPLAITTFDIEMSEGISLESDSPRFQHLSILEVGRATSAAPTFFEPKVVSLKTDAGGFSETYLVDGGLYKNNPSQIGYKKAIDKFGQEEVNRRGVILISIGTGREVLNNHEGKILLKAGALTWAPAIIAAMMSGTSLEDEKIMLDIFSSLSTSSAYLRIQTILNNHDYPKIGEMDNVEPANMNLLLEAAEITKKEKEYLKAIELLKR